MSNSSSLDASPAALDCNPRQTLGLSLLFGTMYFVQGIGEPVAGLVSQPVRSLLRTWGEDAASISAFSALISLPWSLKLFYGLISDFVPLAGSRRRSYLILTSFLTTAGFLALYFFRPAGPEIWVLMALLVVPTFGIAFSDVVVDALMIEKGQPRGLTGVLQSVQWASTYGATLLTGVLGGYLSAKGEEYSAFLICGAFTLVALVLALHYVQEDEQAEPPPVRQLFTALGGAFRSPVLLRVGSLLFLWSLDPLSTTITYLHTTEVMNLGEQFFGTTLSVLALGCIVASSTYGFYCRRFSMGWLTQGSIALGAASQALYFLMHDRHSALVVSFLVGFTWMTASLIQLDLAARACPPAVAATIFAGIMALTNLASSLGEWWGGALYQVAFEHWGGLAAFQLMVFLGTSAKASCWLLFLAFPYNLIAGKASAER